MKSKRSGVILTDLGMKKLVVAKNEAEVLENQGYRFTFEELTEKTSLSADTLIKVFSAEDPVDKITLNELFRAFGLILQPEDYFEQ